jgi:plastocyanin
MRLLIIPFSDSGFTSFEPGTISIPANMTVIWFNNDDDAEHSVTVNTGNSTIYLPEQRLIQI